MKLWALIVDTFRESLARFTFAAFFLMITVILLLFLAAVNLDVVNGAVAAAKLFGKEIELGGESLSIERLVVRVHRGVGMTLFGMGLFLAIFATGGILPEMLKKGRIDVLLSKPISRPALITGRYLGALAIVAFNVTYLVGGVWLITYLKTGVANTRFLMTIPLTVLTFGAVLTFMFLIGLLLHSSPVSIMIGYLVLFLSPGLYATHRATESGILLLITSRFWRQATRGVLEVLYWMLPKVAELGVGLHDALDGATFAAWSALWLTVLSAIGAFALTVMIFRKWSY